MGPGGSHAAMGTHNRLMGLGDIYLEAIAPEPGTAPGRARWFDLDRAGPPRLSAWVVRVEDLETALEVHSWAGEAVALSRGPLRWRMAVPEDGRATFDGLAPALIAWETAPPVLPDSGLRLDGLTLSHPRADTLRATLAPFGLDITVTEGAPAMVATLSDGARTCRLT